MDSRQYMDLMEAYVEVYAPQEEINEADSLAAMQARREKRLAAQRKREGTTSTGRDFGHNYSLTPAQQKARRDAEFKAGTKKEEVEEYIDFLIDEGYDCSDLTWDEIFEEYESLDEGLRSAVKRLLGKKDAPAEKKPMSRGDQLRKKYNVGPEKSDTSAKRQILNRTRAKAERDKEQYGGSRYSKSVADKSQAAHDRYLRGGYSKYGADDRRGSGNKARKRAAALKNEEFDLFDTILEFLYVEGYVDTLEEAEWMMANIIDEEAIGIILGEAITSEKGKAKASEMIAKRTTASGRAKSGKGANVAQIKHIQRSNRDGLGGTPPNRKTAGSNWPKSYSGIGGSGNKAARRAAALKNEEFELWVNSLVEEGYDLSGYTWDDMYEFYLDEAEKPFPHEKVKAKQVALRDKGGNALDRRMKMGMAVRRAKEAEKTGGSQRDAGKGWYHAKEEFVGEDAGIVSGLAGLALGAKGASYAAKHTKRMRDYPKNFVKGMIDPRTYGSKKKKEQKEEFEAWLDEAMTNYEKNRKRAAQRAAARNAARDQGKTGVVPGVGYVTPRRERETWTDESGKTRHAKGL